ncbi:MAG: phosphate acyltransferase PlsX [Clostridia bacterium]|nr:phosphate acyltransferase PlsX [Clostridia bacterium]
MKIVVDCSGNDFGSPVAVKGAVLALNENSDFSLILCGKKEEIESELLKYKFDKSRIEILDAQDVITNEESPTEAVKAKIESSLVRAFDALKQNEEVEGLVSCGSTGAVLTASFLKIGRIKGISRPALCPILPAKDGKKVLLIDSGANVDCKPINLSHFAIMASSYAKAFLGIEDPKVALLNIGTEDKKGNEFTHECFALLKQTPVNFVGNMEARDFLSGKYDIVVADGFYGNILLKSTEGSVGFVLQNIKKEIKSSFLSKIGAVFMRNTFKKLKNTLNYNNYGGAIFLGVKKIVVKGHGSSDAIAFSKSISQAFILAKAKLCNQIEEQILNIGEKLDD